MTNDMGLLLERLRGAKGPDRNIDTDIHWLFSDWENIGGGWVKHKVTGERERTTYAAHPAVTASIDAALALTERMLPGCKKSVTELVAGWSASVLIVDSEHPEFVAEDFHADARTAPLAILAALLLALSTKEG